MRAICLDTNLLVLWIVGSTSRSYIKKHKRCDIFEDADFDLLEKALKQATHLFVTPNALTEASNLLAQIGDPIRTQIRLTFRTFVERVDERSIPSATVVARREFPRLGLTDSALMCAVENGAIILTTDLDLYLAALDAGLEAVNFAHLQEQRSGGSRGK